MKSHRSNGRPIREPRCRCPAGLACILLASLGAGCATQPPPRNLDLRGARIVVGIAPPQLEVSDMPGNRVGGAKTGARAGIGVGGVGAALACLGTGPFFPLCAMALVPAGMAVGAGTGAAVGVGVVAAQGSTTVDDQSSILKAELVAVSHQTLLAEQLRDRLSSEHALELPVGPGHDVSGAGETRAGDRGEPLVLQVSVTEMGTEGRRVFAVRLVAQLVLRRGSTIVWRTAREVQSETELSLDGWTAGDSAALRAVLDTCVRTAARQLVGGLARGLAGSGESRAPAGDRYSTSCEDRPVGLSQAKAKP